MLPYTLVNKDAIEYIDLASLELDFSIDSIIRTNAVDSLPADCTKKVTVRFTMKKVPGKLNIHE